jgi:hypothetical protein
VCWRFTDSACKRESGREPKALLLASACVFHEQVALDGSSNDVLGCIDIRLPQTTTGSRAVGEPDKNAFPCLSGDEGHMTQRKVSCRVAEQLPAAHATAVTHRHCSPVTGHSMC